MAMEKETPADDIKNSIISSSMQKSPSAVYTIAAVFILLAIVFIPFPFHLFPYQLVITDTVFRPLIKFTATTFFNTALTEVKVYSDFRSMYILVFILLVISLIAGLIIKYALRKKEIAGRITGIIFLLCVYYLSLMLLKYGLDKVFKHQFYLPEPNILYTPLGRVDKDLLYWSSVGTSRLYNLFSGGVEVLAALLLLFRRTRFAGSLLASAVMAQVWAINISFDISVKVYAGFLLLCALFILFRYKSRLQVLVAPQSTINLPAMTDVEIWKHPFVRIFLKSLLTGFILFESFYPYVRSSNYNDDIAPRPFMHGAYGVQRFISGSDTITGASVPVKRFFVHRQGYLIFQDQQEGMQDFKLDYDTAKGTYFITDYQQHQVPLRIQYNAADSTLEIRYQKKNMPVVISGKGLDWRKLPALRNDFHWTVD